MTSHDALSFTHEEESQGLLRINTPLDNATLRTTNMFLADTEEDALGERYYIYRHKKARVERSVGTVGTHAKSADSDLNGASNPFADVSEDGVLAYVSHATPTSSKRSYYVEIPAMMVLQFAKKDTLQNLCDDMKIATSGTKDELLFRIMAKAREVM